MGNKRHESALAIDKYFSCNLSNFHTLWARRLKVTCITWGGGWERGREWERVRERERERKLILFFTWLLLHSLSHSGELIHSVTRCNNDSAWRIHLLQDAGVTWGERGKTQVRDTTYKGKDHIRKKAVVHVPIVTGGEEKRERERERRLGMDELWGRNWTGFLAFLVTYLQRWRRWRRGYRQATWAKSSSYFKWTSINKSKSGPVARTSNGMQLSIYFLHSPLFSLPFNLTLSRSHSIASRVHINKSISSPLTRSKSSYSPHQGHNPYS